MNLNTAVLSGYLLAAFAPSVHRATRRGSGWLLALLPLSLTLYFASLIPAVANGGALAIRYAWAPALGVELAFRLDGLSLLFTLLIAGIGTLVTVYSGSYLEGDPRLGRFYCFLLVFMASMLGLTLADNVLALYVFWELTSISSYLLIGYDNQDKKSRDAAWQALLVTSLGGLALLAGVILLAQAAGTYTLSELIARGDLLRNHPSYTPALLLVVLGAFTKSAQFPFHFWLPAAMAAPTPVSAYLHSATMVKAGVYILARMHPALGGTEAWFYLLTLGGGVTMVIGAVIAFRETDLKRILAFSTVSVLGLLTLLIGIGGDQAAKAMVVYLLAHALYKGALFLMAGAVDHETGLRDISRLSGLRRAMPVIASAAALAAASMAGLPPLLGYLGKELFYEAAQHSHTFAWILTAAGFLASVFLVAVAALVAVKPFFGPLAQTPKHPHDPGIALWLGPAVLAGGGLLFGVVPALIERTLAASAAHAIVQAPLQFELALFHGFTPTLALSAATLATGLGVYALHGRAPLLDPFFRPFERWGPARWYDLAFHSVNALARAQTAFLQNGYLKFYVMTIVLTTYGLVGFTLLSRGFHFPGGTVADARLLEIVLAAVILVAGLVAVRSDSRFAAVLALGVVGLGISLLFLLFGAPDLAMTQFLVETLTVILLVLILYRLPLIARMTPTIGRVRDGLIAIAGGAATAVLVIAASEINLAPKISSYYVQNSLPAAHGRNIVNVILVDFRGLDTMGEITVLAVAGIGVYALLKLRVVGKED